MRSLSCSTQLCAVIGNPVAHSLSPAIHNAAFEFLDLDFIYVSCPVEDVKGALGGMRAIGNFRGMSVTIPHKTEVIKYVDEIAAVDRNILRMALFEFLFLEETPRAVVINEALEIAKRYSTEESSPFINGVLDGIRRVLEGGEEGEGAEETPPAPEGAPGEETG